MKIRAMARLTALGVALALTACGGNDLVAPQRPNILLIVGDDMGYSDIGAFGSEIRTPHLDALAAEGRLLTSFYSGAVCAPSRAMLMSGADHHRVGVGVNPEVVASLILRRVAPFGTEYGFDNLPPEYRGYLRDDALSLPELMRDHGYRTLMSGKWHLAQEVARPQPGELTPGDGGLAELLPVRPRPASFPNARGFDQSFMLLDFGASHFAPVPGKPTRYDLGTYGENDRTFHANALPQDFYSSTHFTDKLLEYLKSGQSAEQPFFAYLSYTAPHFPLQAPAEDIAAYAGHYDAGYDVIRARRLQRLKELGLIAPDFAMFSVPPKDDPLMSDRPWTELNADERAYQARVMEVYAAMVTHMDRQIGRVIEHLKDSGQYDNTLIVFLSDNGPDDGREAPEGPNLDNSLDNLGRPGSAGVYGTRWAEVGATPFRMWKGRAGAEGAHSTPALVKLPRQSAALPAVREPVHITDLLPTFLEAAGIALPRDRYQGRAIVNVEGVSQWRALQSAAALAPAARAQPLAGEVLGISAYVRDGGWKLSKQPVAGDSLDMGFDDIAWQLFDMVTDRGETRDVAADHPGVVALLRQQWDAYVERNRVLLHTATPDAP